MKSIWRVFRYLKYFPQYLALHLGMNLLHVVFCLFSYVLIIPFIELLFGMTQPPDTMPELALNQQALTGWLLWQVYALKTKHGIAICMLAVSVGYIAMAFLSNLCRYMAFYFMAPIRHGIIQHLRDDVYHKITILPVSYFNKRQRGDIISRMSNDLADVEWSVISTITALGKDPINILFFVATLILISPKLFLCFLVILPVVAFFISKIGKSLKRNSNKGQSKLGGVFSILDETLGGIKTIKSFGREEAMQAKFEQSNEEYTKTMAKVVRHRELGGPLSELLGTVALAAILVIGGTLALNGELQPSVFIFFVIVFLRLIPPIQSIIKAYNNLQKGNAAADRFFQILDADEVILEKPDATVIQSFQNDIVYRDISFAYNAGEDHHPVYVLKDINLTIPKGKTIAIVGPSGAGKTTLADLLPRFYDSTAGDILIDGIPIRELNINSLRKIVGLVSQNCILFNDTIAHNIAFGSNDVPLSKIREASRMAYADEFITAFADGYDTMIGDRGLNLSGGQRQRISIARALLKNPPILILDEATSALDTESEHAVQEALAKLMDGRTCLVIAHRLSTIQKADEIIVMDHGEIVERGTHATLKDSGGLYAKLLEMQKL